MSKIALGTLAFAFGSFLRALLFVEGYESIFTLLYGVIVPLLLYIGWKLSQIHKLIAPKPST